MQFIPYHNLGDTTNIIVDGSPTSATVLTLSHWPKSGTPKELKADLSVEIVFNYINNSRFQKQVEAVSNNHFDEDGLVSLYSILNPEEATKSKEMLIDIARAGDFSTYKRRESARIAFVISTFADPELSPLDPKIFELKDSELDAHLYKELLNLLPEMIKDPKRYSRYWKLEEEYLNASEAALRKGLINIEEIKLLDLAIVKLPEEIPVGIAHRFAIEKKFPCHPMAIYNLTDCNRILFLKGRNYELQYRYETWVQYISRKLIPRVDLNPLAMLLTEKEAVGKWKFDGVESITPSLTLQEAYESSISPEVFVSKVKSYLETAKPAWNPYD